MPKIRYSLAVENDVLEEEIYFVPGDAKSLVTKEVEWINSNRRKTGDKEATLIGYRVTNPFIHLHPWVRGRVHANAERVYYHCSRCGITGWRRWHIVKGEIGGINLDEKFQKKKHEMCHDTLKSLPKLVI